MLPSSPVPFGRYELVHCLGQGRLGEVHLARLRGEAGFEKLYVLKTLAAQPDSDPQLLQRFQHEARVLVQLQHPNIAQVYELGHADGTAFMAMEYVPGVELARVLSRARQVGAVVPIPLALYVAQRVAEALGHAHRKVGEDGAPLDIVHRAISPDTVRVSFDGEVKVLDFSLARSSAALASTGPARVMGRLGYMSPEQARAEKVDARSDIYSCGVVLWEMLAGRRLFGDMPAGELLAGMAHPVIPSLHLLRPDISPSLEEVLRRALAPSVGERYARADELVRALNDERVREGARVGDAEVRAWVRAVCPQELADHARLIASLPGGGGTAVSRPASGSLEQAPTHVSQEGVPTALMEPRAVAARKDPTSMMMVGALGLVLAGVLATVFMSLGGKKGVGPDTVDAGEAGGIVQPVDAGDAGAVDAGDAGAADAGDAGDWDAGDADAGDAGDADAGDAGDWDAGDADAGDAGDADAGDWDAGDAGDADAGVPEPDAGKGGRGGSKPGATYELVRVEPVQTVTERNGQYFLWAGSTDGVALGTRVQLVGAKKPDGSRPLYGTAVVQELLGGTGARLRLEKSPPRGIRVYGHFTPESPRPAFEAEAQVSGAGARKEIILFNRGTRAWTKCKLRLLDRKASLPRLEAGARQSLWLMDLDPAPPKMDLHGAIDLSCAEGSVRLRPAGL